MAFKKFPHRIYINYRTLEKLFNLRCMATNRKVRNSLIREFLYGKDCYLFVHSESDLQNLFSNACTALGLVIISDKTVMYQPDDIKECIETSV